MMVARQVLCMGCVDGVASSRSQADDAGRRPMAMTESQGKPELSLSEVQSITCEPVHLFTLFCLIFATKTHNSTTMTSSLLSSHLDQIALCASSISDLPFSRPKQFTNALLTHHDITALIRDTEQHERALFSIAPPPVPSKSQIQQISSTFTTSASRSIVAPNTQRPPRRHTAVAAVLGGDLYRKTRSGHSGKQAKGEIDVELLLRGAEKLCRV